MPCTVLGTLNEIFLCAGQEADPVLIHMGQDSKQNHRNPFGSWWGETNKWMHAVGGYKYKNKTGMRNGNVRQAGCNFKYWGPTWLHEEAFVGGMANEMGPAFPTLTVQ